MENRKTPYRPRTAVIYTRTLDNLLTWANVVTTSGSLFSRWENSPTPKGRKLERTCYLAWSSLLTRLAMFGDAE